jgi:gliding motility associated protien GldN
MKKIAFIVLFSFASCLLFAQNTKPKPKPTTPVQNKQPAAVPAVQGPQKPKVEPIYSIFQKSEENKKKAENIAGKDSIKCAPEYPRVKKDDVIFAKRIKRDIYFIEEANKYLVPKTASKNFLHVLFKAIEDGKIDAYQAWSDNDGKLIEPINFKDLLARTTQLAGIADITQAGESPGLRNKAGIRIIEDWYFDTNRAEFKPYIIALSVIVPTNAAAIDENALFGTITGVPNPTKLDDPSIKIGEVGKGMTSLFYVNYPTIRDQICKSLVFHPNQNIRYSFDDVFQLRFFSSLIVEETNADGIALGNKKGIDGKDLTGLDKLLEADRIKRSLIQYEQDMWEQ